MVIFPIHRTPEQEKNLTEFHRVMKSNFGRRYSIISQEMIMNVVYINSFTNSNGEHGLAIFTARHDDNVFYKINYGHCVISQDVVEYNPIQVTKEEYEQMIANMKQEIFENESNH
jgi:hypothetical protein